MNDSAEQYEAAALRYKALQKELATLNKRLAVAAGKQQRAATRAYETYLLANIAVLKAEYRHADRRVLLHLDAIAASAYRSFLQSAADLETRLAPLREQVSNVIGQLTEQRD